MTDNLTPMDQTTTREIQTFLPTSAVRWGWPDVLLGLGAFILSAMLGVILALALRVDISNVDAVGLFSLASAILGYATIVTVVVLAARRKGLGSLAADFGLRFQRADILLGVAIGFVAKVFAFVLTLVTVTVTNHVPETGNFELSSSPLWIVLNGFLVAVLIAPLAEELFFRGLVLRAAHNRVLRRGGTTRRAVITAVIASSLSFAGLHLYQSPDVTLLIILGGATLFIGVVNSWVTLATGRLGAAIIAHAFFNGSSVVLALLAGAGA